MSAETSRTVNLLTETDAAKLIESGDFSKSLRDILNAAALPHGKPTVMDANIGQKKSPGYLWSSANWWSLLAVLHAAGQRRSRAQGAASVFESHSQFVASMTEKEVRTHTLGYNVGTSEVGTALQDALEIRESTGGDDRWIGLRHALFSIMLPPEPSMFRETYELLADAGTSPAALAKSVAEFCLENSEKTEDESVWQRLIDDRLPKLEAMSFAVASGLQVATPGADDPWAEGKVDRSGAQLEAEAFASMICWSDFTPPLAVGVFGDWGKGKSFFMRLVHDAIEARAGNQPGFLKHVVQIRFNAWHYAETNLWASLVDHILTELDAWAEREHTSESSQQVFARLDTAREGTLAAARDLVARREATTEAQRVLEEANTALRDKKKALADDPDSWRMGIWNELLTTEEVEKCTAALKNLGLTEEGTTATEELRRAIALYNPETGGAVAQDWWRFLWNHKVWAVVLVVAIFVLPVGVAAFMEWLEFSGIGGAIAGAATPIVTAMVAVSRTLKTGHAKLASAHAKVQGEIDKKAKGEARKRAEAEADLAAAELAMAKAEQALSDTETALRDAKREYQFETGKGRILKFVRDRVTSGDYRKQLSFIAKVRRDFDELSALMNAKPAPQENALRREQHEQQVKALIEAAGPRLEDDEIERLRATYETLESDSEGPVFQRIVLYIDDLDRCPADQVVVVLQAIHLLLAYPLFVVFVAVDVRWLQQALETSYDQFKGGESQSDDHANASDYLEKIFQVPYWVRAMTPENTSDLLTDLMAVPADSENESNQFPRRQTDNKPNTPDPLPSTDSSTTPEPDDSMARESKEQANGAEPPSPAQLEFSDEEAEFVRNLSEGLDGSPRRTLRFINSYRLIKASLPLTQRRRLASGSYRSILALLAVQICSEDIGHDGKAKDCFHALAQKLSSESEPDGLMGWADVLPNSEAQKRLVTVLKAYFDNGGQLSELAEHVSVVARYSFAKRMGPM